MRTVKRVALALGVLVLAGLVYRIGIDAVLEALHRLTWWRLVVVCVPYALIMAVDTLGWRFAFARDGVPFTSLFGARVVGEAINIVTVMGEIGEGFKAWLLRRDVSYQESVPSVVIAKTTITVAQALFLLVGIVLAWTTLDVGPDVLHGMVWLFTIEVVAVAGLLGAQLSGLLARAGALLRIMGIDESHAKTLDASLRHYYRHQWRRCALSICFHLLGWALGALEAVVIFWALRLDASLTTATVIEALGSGVRFAAFLVPASLGALESANAAAFASLGLGAGAGFAFTLVRRAREVVWVAIGLAGLFALRKTSGQA